MDGYVPEERSLCSACATMISTGSGEGDIAVA